MSVILVIESKSKTKKDVAEPPASAETKLSLQEEKELSGSQILLQSLLAEEVTTIFGYPGGAIMPIYDALYDYQEKLKHILVRHEQGAIHAAQGFARG